MRARGNTMIEVLITIVITGVGLLGVAGVQARMHLAEMEAYQRAQATINCRILPGQSPNDVQATLARVVGDDEVSITPLDIARPSEPSPLASHVIGPIERITAELWPGVPVIPTMSTGATDSLYLRNAGMSVYGVSGIFADIDDNRAHRVGAVIDADGVGHKVKLVTCGRATCGRAACLTCDVPTCGRASRATCGRATCGRAACLTCDVPTCGRTSRATCGRATCRRATCRRATCRRATCHVPTCDVPSATSRRTSGMSEPPHVIRTPHVRHVRT